MRRSSTSSSALKEFTLIADSPVRAILDQWLDTGLVKCASLLVLHRGRDVLRYHRGLCRFTNEEIEVTDTTLFTIASPTKTLTASCFMQLVEHGALSLHDPVAASLPKFGQNGKDRVTFFHLLTHTSGLSEQVEGKDELRLREAPLGEFNDRICRAKPSFEPGTDYQYSNCGFSILARVVEEIEGRRFGDLLADRVLQPLGMRDSVLGADETWDERIAEIELPAGGESTRAFLNKRYWRGMGAPWGAMISNTRDLARFGEAVRNGGGLDGARILSPATVESMTRDRLASLPELADRHDRPRQGLGWIPQSGALYGDLVSSSTYGHHGATGSLLWIDPVNEVTFVFLGNKEGSVPPHCFARLSNAVIGALPPRRPPTLAP